MRRALAAITATAAVIGGVALAAPAQAQYASMITSAVYWTGPDCITVQISRAPNGFGTELGTACGGYSERTYFAVPGQYVGADPMPLPNSPTTTLGCSLRIDGQVDNADYAPAGDVHHNVDCLRVLTSSAPSYSDYPGLRPPPPPVPRYQPPPLLRAF